MQPALRMLIAAMIVGGAAAAPLVYAGPQLYRDMRTASWTAAATFAATSSSCRSWAHIVWTCTITYIDRFEPERAQPPLHYFTFGSWAGERGTLLKSTVDPTHITMTLGIEHMEDRKLTFAVWTAAAIGIITLFLILRARAFPHR
jgi:cytochrome c biogenesis factor